MPVSPALVRAALRARARAEKALAEAERLEARAGIDRRALAIARAKLGARPDPAHAAILRSLTVAVAADLCGTTPDQMKKAWKAGPHFRPAPAAWRRRLAGFGVPVRAWRDQP